MNIRWVQLDVQPGRPRENVRRMKTFIAEAKRDGIDLIIFPEMSIPGYLISDIWEQPAFLRDCESGASAIRDCSHGISILFGSVGVDRERRNEDGRVRKYNAGFLAENGAFVGPENGPYDFVIKTLLPNYREFDDSRHFYDVRKLAIEERVSVESLIAPIQLSSGLRVGCILCEDAWDMDYSVSPINILGDRNVDLFINLSASPFTMNKNHKRGRVFSKHAKDQGRPLIYVNQVGLQNNGKTVYTFDGGSCIYDAHGGCREQFKPFTEGTDTVTFNRGDDFRIDTPLVLKEDGIETVAEALMYGTTRFMELCRVDHVVVGASGGIDSAVVAAIYGRILPPEQLTLVNMPSRFNSNTTRTAARALAERLGCLYVDVSIEDSVAETHRQLAGLHVQSIDGRLAHELELSPLVQENIQARDRSARVLAGIASACGGVFTCNANKSEATVGYTTLYGDLGGYLANLGDLWKTDVYALARHINAHGDNGPVIPVESIDVKPSAELSDAHNVDKGRGDPMNYPYHDCLFRSWVERWQRATPEDILDWYKQGTLTQELGYDGSVDAIFANTPAFIADLERWWNLYQGMGVAKRIQAPPILAVKKRAFGFDHRESQLGPYYSERYDALKAELLVS
ncbi:MAG: NAD+ synthase (glutamine-hydrolyzing) [Candidatus Promineifilaceae bacterium]|jgi:NAD+ synthase (glutamine-hydrolysing)